MQPSMQSWCSETGDYKHVAATRNCMRAAPLLSQYYTGCSTSLLTPSAGEDIAKETAKEWKGLRVTVKLTVQNRVAKVGTAVCVTSVCRSWSAAAMLRRGSALHVMVCSNRLYTICIQSGRFDRA
jgi:hypothetical protein